MGDEEPAVGSIVSVDAEWPNGRVMSLPVMLISVRDDDAYVMTDVGAVAGIRSTPEACE